MGGVTCAGAASQVQPEAPPSAVQAQTVAALLLQQPGSTSGGINVLHYKVNDYSTY